MFNISSFLEKFSKNLKNNDLYKDQIIEKIQNEINISLKSEDIEIKNNIIYTKTNPSAKNQIFILKNKIIEKINSSLPIKIKDIK